MTSLIMLFSLAAALSLLLSPFLRWLSPIVGAVDNPGWRKTHGVPIPNLGGVAVFVAFFLPLFVLSILQRGIFALELAQVSDYAFFGGCLAMLILGLADDIWSINPYLKLAVQLMVGVIVYLGGVQIGVLTLPLTGTIQLGWLSLPLTVFWIVLVVNAINLMDGLDGLATGIVFFVCLVMLVLQIMDQRFFSAACFAALAGATGGFLRYNFHPASIFLGNSGAYFLGFAVAALSINGAVKGAASVAILMPVVALGLPLTDVMLSFIRRILRGMSFTRSDKEHIHHQVLGRSSSYRLAVLLLYSVSVVLGVLALLMTITHDERSTLILVVLAFGMFIFIRWLGYLKKFQIHKGDNQLWGDDSSDRSAVPEGFVARECSQAIEKLSGLGFNQVTIRLVSGECFTHQTNGMRSGGPPRAVTLGKRTGGKMYFLLPLRESERYFGVIEVDKAWTIRMEEYLILLRLEVIRRKLSKQLALQR